MPGRSQSGLLALVGVLAFAVGFVGYTVFGWRFGGSESSVTFALGVAAALVAVAVTVRRRL